MSYMTLSSQETPAISKKNSFMTPFFTLFVLTRASDNTTSQNNIGVDECMGRPPTSTFGGTVPQSPPGLRPCIKSKNLVTFVRYLLLAAYRALLAYTSATSASSDLSLSHSHHEARSTHTIVTQFAADYRMARLQREFINGYWYLNLNFSLIGFEAFCY